MIEEFEDLPKELRFASIAFAKVEDYHQENQIGDFICSGKILVSLCMNSPSTSSSSSFFVWIVVFVVYVWTVPQD